MADHLMVVLSNARPELEDEFNDWYTHVHIEEIVDRLDGFEAAQRFTLAGTHRGVVAPYKYLTLYWIPEGKLDAARTAIAWQSAERAEALAAGRQPVINRQDLFDGDPIAWFFSRVSDRYSRTPRTAADEGGG